MHIAEISAAPWLLPLAAPFRVAKRTAYEAQNVLVTITSTDAACGLGAAAPVGYVTEESVQTVVESIEQIAPALAGQPVERLAPLVQIAALLDHAPSARAALEMAILDLWAKRWALPLWQFFGAAQTRLTTDLTIPIVEPDHARELAKEAYAEGFAHLKIKIGSPDGADHDFARLVAVLEGAPLARLRIDANQGFSAGDAVTFLRRLQDKSQAVELVEQPVPHDDIAGLRYVKERCDLPVIADESAQSPASVLRLLQEDAVDGINIKIMKSGLFGALQIANICRIWGKKIMIGCMLESRLGQAASCQLAAGVGGFDFIDLDAHRLLSANQPAAGGFRDDGSVLTVDSDQAGWGVQIIK